ncbi:midkine-A-like isoform X1 [Ostrea edulis]|uniref:midkine-A-like isoform X1 n=1 Tax=Ostrea edulis TaxID=37623 RepID=UPI0024AEAD9D|nr:midkine-A-like isoform X1 [Ostrea edulis]XP_048766136.2 midkine-A-like isoform X1 [Ostrea edulis]
MNNKIVVVLVVVLLAVSLTEARRRKNKANRNPDRCIYKRDKSAGKPECIKGSMNFTMKLKSGAANCTETMTKVKNCRNKDCKYKVVSMECNQVTNKMVKTMQLKEGGDETKCEKTITVEKRRCKNNADKAAKKAARKEKNKARKAARKAARKSAKGARRARKHNKGMKEGSAATLQEPTA